MAIRQGSCHAEVEGQQNAVFNPAHAAKYGRQLGAKYFQGTLTPSEQKLADLQRRETQDQLQQALKDAQDAVDTATAGSLVYNASTGKTNRTETSLRVRPASASAP